MLLTGHSAIATPACFPDIIATIRFESGLPKAVDYHFIGNFHCSDAQTTNELISQYAAGKNILHKTYDFEPYFAQNHPSLPKIRGLADDGDIFLTKCWDYHLYDPLGNPKYLSDGIIIHGRPIFYNDFLPGVYFVIALLLPSLMVLRLKGSIKKLILPTRRKIFLFAPLFLLSIFIFFFGMVSLGWWGWGCANFKPGFFAVLTAVFLPFYLFQSFIIQDLIILRSRNFHEFNLMLEFMGGWTSMIIIMFLNWTYLYILSCFLAEKPKADSA